MSASLIALLKGPKKKGSEDEEEEKDEGSSSDAGQALLDAIEAKDAAAVVDAFKLLKEECEYEE